MLLRQRPNSGPWSISQNESNMYNTVRSKSNCAPGILKQERYPVFEKSITKYFELSILCEEQ